ncbi:MAG: AlpA family transcriptional regulator [Truepera sp.]|nr:AlpA family transcriptional regulator [Truepera sp.]
MPTRFLRRPEVEARTGLSRSSIYALMDKSEFPRPRRIGKRAVAWDEAQIERWLSNRAEADPLDLYSPKRRTAETTDPSSAS